MALCLAAGAVAARLAVDAFTLAWTHSVERILWEEDWRVEHGALVLVESRVRGSGAGMEPGPDARLEGGTWRWRPELAPIPQLVLARTPDLEDWRLCTPEGCRPLGSLLPRGDGPVSLSPCREASCPEPCATASAQPTRSSGSGGSQSIGTSPPTAISSGATSPIRHPEKPPPTWNQPASAGTP